MSKTVRDSTGSPYNTAYLQDDRSRLYVTYDVDPAFDDGFVHPQTGQETAPPDYEQRRRAVVAFYGERCGRCGGAVATTRPDDEESLAHVLSLGEYDDRYDRWELEALVPLCRPCYDVIEADDPDALGGVNDAFDRAPQFPSWVCDPRVAVERAPLTGEELWRRERLAEALDEQQFDFGVNDPVAGATNLATDTCAARAVALGQADVRDRVSQAPPKGLDIRWERLDGSARRVYENRVRSASAILESGDWDENRSDRLPVGTAVEAVASD